MSGMLKVSTGNRVAQLTLNRPESRNALAPELVSELIQAVRDADADPAVKCILIRGEGEHFSAGGDVKGFAALMATPQDRRQDLFERKVLAGNRLPQTLLEARKPVVAVVRGAIAGAGVGLCLAADYVLCGQSAYFVAAHVHVGLALDCGLSPLLVAAMGIKQAMRMALLGERIEAEQALRLGMVTEVLPDEELPAATEKLLQRLAAGPAIAMAATKELLNEAAYGDVERLLALEARAVGVCAATSDFATGIEAVRARKKPQFD
jgi:2-(1,2-epoxy-1,2-dihydrophenyl)acetyl-CoA isomerase